MIKILSALLLLTTISAHAASVRITVDIQGTPKEGLVYFDYSMNSHNGMDYIHLDKLRVRVGREGYNVAARSVIDDHICQLLGYSYADYRIIGAGAYESAEANIVRENGRNIIVPISRGRDFSQHFSIDLMTCARESQG